MASERIEKLLAMQQKAEAQKRKAEQQLKAAKQPLPVSPANKNQENGRNRLVAYARRWPEHC